MDEVNGQITLVKPTAAYKQAVLEYRDEFIQNDEVIHGSGDIERMVTFEAWLQACSDGEHEETMPNGRVPASQYLAIRPSDNSLVGMLQIRHSLNEHLKLEGGHIGYSVRKSERRKGYATHMLNEALAICHDLKIQKVLVTCKPENIGSASVIKANGGIYEKQVVLEDGTTLDHYWISKF